MRLKKLELYGFKSFAQRTEIVFNEGITGIVGPNGSGKSNIGDAVRWVLGEQSAKTLRGASMQDVIFSGTQKRKPLGYCEVSLVFDNDDRALPLDYAEVMVTRRVYRSGDSEYYLNRSACRLKDIIDLFRDTGIGKEGYSIIGQGRIDEILSRKGEDRRQVFEEAAGIVKFKFRKEEADKKLAHTLDNLSRVDDILDELKRRLNPLEDQAKSARVYLELSAELKVLDLNLFLARSDKMEARLRELDADLQGIRAALDQTEVTLQQKTEQRDARQAEITALEEKITEAHAALMTGMERVHEAQNAAHEVSERRKNRAENRARIEEEIALAGARMAEADRLSENGDSDTETQSALLTEAEGKLAAAKQAEEDARSEEKTRETALEDEKDAMLGEMNRQAAAMNDQTRLTTMLSTMEARLAEVTAGSAELREAGETLEAAVRDAEERLEKETRLQAELEKDLQSTREALDAADASVISARQDYDAKLSEARDMESRRSLLEEMSREMEGYAHSVKSAVRYAREENMTGVRGTLSQLIRVPQKYETAIDTVLGNTQQDIVTEDEETAKILIEYLRANRLGRATFLPMTTVKARLLDEREKKALDSAGCLGVACDLIEYDGDYRGIVENVLGRTAVADTLAHAIEIARKGGHAFRVVTLQGDIMHSGGSMTGGSASGRTLNLFSRERELKELTEKLSVAQSELETLLTRMRDGQRNKERLKEESATALEALHQQEIAVARETERVSNATAEAENHTARLAESDAAAEQLKEAMEEIRAQLGQVSGDADKSRFAREEAEARIAEKQKALTEARERAEAASEETLRLTLEVSDTRHTLETLRRDRERYLKDREQILREQEKRKSLLEEMAGADAKDEALSAELEKRTEEARQEQAGRETVTRSLEDDRSRKQALLKEILSDMEGLHETHSRDADRAHRLELSRARTDGDLKTMRDRIWNTYEVTYAGAEEYRKTEGFNLTEADRRAAQLSTEIRALGVVNVRAVEEYAETKARYDELFTQRKDLEKAETDLRDLIDRLLGQMRTTFVENFEKLQGYFSETFTRLFGGGSAEITLTDPDDPLNCGIEINAQPPGKKLQLLSLLSGGERTLTAIAILFATLKLKPTPFCILDEIEAALDDANIGYFADYLVEYSKSTQFVVVTHRKGTMERADSLYGVAMEEQGVSKMVSVSLQDYKE